jgi:hypothetical protein
MSSTCSWCSGSPLARSRRSTRSTVDTQETFVTLWMKRKKVTIVDESLLPWLLSVCKNQWRNLSFDGVRIPRGGRHGKYTQPPMGIQIGSTNFARAASAIAVCSRGGAPSCSRRPISIELSTTSLQRSSRRAENAASALATV